MHELLQSVIEERQLSLAQYHRFRRLLIYLPVGLRGPILGTLTSLLQASRQGSDPPAPLIQAARDGQSQLRIAMGLDVIDKMVSRLTAEE